MNEWIIFWIDICHFWWKVPFFVYFWTLFGQFSGTFLIRPVLIILWLLNWIIFWIESPEFILNWIIFWNESWVKRYWIEYWMNHFLAKFKYWIESDWVSFTTRWRTSQGVDIPKISQFYWALFEKTRFLCFYIIKSMARKGYFGPKSDFRGSKIPPRGASSTWNM